MKILKDNRTNKSEPISDFHDVLADRWLLPTIPKLGRQSAAGKFPSNAGTHLPLASSELTEERHKFIGLNIQHIYLPS